MIISYSDLDVIKNNRSIFLAGPTPRNAETDSWRELACKKLEELGFDGVVYVPEYSNGTPRINYYDQVMWERKALTNATVIVFWVPRTFPNMPAFTTNVEFGYWLHSGKVIYGRPDNAEKKEYLDWLYKEDYNKNPINDMDELLKEAVALVDKLHDEKEPQILPLSERKILKK